MGEREWSITLTGRGARETMKALGVTDGSFGDEGSYLECEGISLEEETLKKSLRVFLYLKGLGINSKEFRSITEGTEDQILLDNKIFNTIAPHLKDKYNLMLEIDRMSDRLLKDGYSEDELNNIALGTYMKHEVDVGLGRY